MSDFSEAYRIAFLERSPASSDWFDLWHTHVDWDGKGNESPEERRRFLRELFAVWAEVESWANGLPQPWQTWVLIDPADSGQDSVYLHTRNPNKDNFPYSFENVCWGVKPPSWLGEFTQSPSLTVGLSEWDGESLYWVRRSCVEK